jgi:hypothetical protein
MTFYYTVKQVDGMSSEYTVPKVNDLHIDIPGDNVTILFTTAQDTRKLLTCKYSDIITMRVSK